MEKPIQKAKVYKEQDRIDLASILIANGYKCWFGKEPKASNKKASEYYVYYQEVGSDDTAVVTTA